MRHLQILCGLVLFSCTQALVFPNLRSQECEKAGVCNETLCAELGEANCHCSGNETKFALEDRPQIVYLTFDDAFTAIAEEDFYRVLFNGTYKNPNGCNIRATHFITQSYTDYELVNRYWHKGHEIAAHSITHRNDISYWEKMDVAGWKDEMVGVRKMIAQFATLDPCEITGNRAPFLQGGGDAMFQMLKENNFEYDCTWPTRKFGYLDAEAALYPYTLDYASVQDCPIEPCPKCEYPGLWVQPMIDLEDDWIGSNPMYPNNGNVCSMLDGCVIMNQPETAETVYEMLMKNFMRVYYGETDDFGDFQPGNKAPWGLYMHAAWFFGENRWHYDGYRMFLDELTGIYDNGTRKYPDVFIVDVKSGINYMKRQLPMQIIDNYGKGDHSPFGCEAIEGQTGKYAEWKCGGGQSCKFDAHFPDDGIDGERYMNICRRKNNHDLQSCPTPDNYPWLGNHCGGNNPCNDCEK